MDSNIELSKLSQRLDAAAKQFKKMMQTINELQASNNELQLRVSKLEAKLNNSSTNQDSSTSSKSTSTVGTSNNQDKSVSKPSNGSSLPTTHQDEEKPTEGKEMVSTSIVASTGTSNVEDCSKDNEVKPSRDESESIQDKTSSTSNDKSSSSQEKSSTTDEKASSGITIPKDEEKPTEAQQMPSNGKELRYLDRKTGKQYATEAEAQKNGADPMFLYDTKSGRCVFSYTSPVSHSNEQSGMVAHQEDLKPV